MKPHTIIKYVDTVEKERIDKASRKKCIELARQLRSDLKEEEKLTTKFRIIPKV